MPSWIYQSDSKKSYTVAQNPINENIVIYGKSTHNDDTSNSNTIHIVLPYKKLINEKPKIKIFTAGFSKLIKAKAIHKMEIIIFSCYFTLSLLSLYFSPKVDKLVIATKTIFISVS